MASSFLLKALAQHKASVTCTLFLLILLTAFSGGDVPVVLVLWIVASAVTTASWQIAEHVCLKLRGCRPLDAGELERHAAALNGLACDVFVVDHADAWCVRFFRTIVVGADALSQFDQRQLRALLTNLAFLDPAAVAGSRVVWIGCLPWLIAWQVNGWVMQLGRALALLVGNAMRLVLIIWPDAFVRWGGYLLGAMLSGMLSSLLISSGVVAPGLALMTCWAVVPAIRWIIGWETDRAQNLADEATVASGLGWELMDTIDYALLHDPQPEPPALLGRLGHVWAAQRSRLNSVAAELKDAPKS